MRPIWRRLTACIAIGGAAVIVLGLAAYAAGARVNTTRSIPVGLYWNSDAPATTGAYVLFCPPQVGVFEEAKRRGYIGAGFCPGGYGLMMKKILAGNNDVVDIVEEGVRVNGALLPLSVPLKADKGGRPLPRFQARHFAVGNSEWLLMSDVSATSFDGRYFGPINRSQIKTVISPVLVW